MTLCYFVKSKVYNYSVLFSECGLTYRLWKTSLRYGKCWCDLVHFLQWSRMMWQTRKPVATWIFTQVVSAQELFPCSVTGGHISLQYLMGEFELAVLWCCLYIVIQVLGGPLGHVFPSDTNVYSSYVVPSASSWEESFDELNQTLQ